MKFNVLYTYQSGYSSGFTFETCEIGAVFAYFYDGPDKVLTLKVSEIISILPA